ncbi:MAG: alpha/beta fold hydrolase, partial [Notoacmeibacter sp.]
VSLPALVAPKTSPVIDKNNPIKRMAFVTLPDGRRLDYFEQGAANGQPVLLFHNVPYGVELPAAAIKKAFAENLRFIAPLRAGYAKSALLPDCHGDELISQNADDHAALLDALKIKNVVAVGHSGGSHIALRFASRHPSRVTALIALARAPIWREQWMQAMPQQQRLVFRLAKYMPKMLPVVLWSMMACLNTSYATKFIRAASKDSVADAKAAENQETVDLITKGALIASLDSLEGFARECVISQLDLTEEARATKLKFHILHGNGDGVVPLMQSQTFVEEVPGTTLEIVENAGQLLFYSHWPQVMAAVLKAMRR